jgi:NDP-sugar pyrophosphorylase family protein
VILAAGKGKRFGPLTDEVPKALVPVAGKTLLEWAVERTSQTGIDDVVVAVGWKGSMIRDFITQNRIDVSVVDVPNYEVGPLQTLLTAIETFEGDFLLSPVDAMIEPAAVIDMLSHHNTLSIDEGMSLAVGSNLSQGTPVELDPSGQITEINNVTLDAENATRSAMLLIAHTRIRELCKSALEGGKEKVVQLLDLLLKQGGHIQAFFVPSSWYDIDTLSDLLMVNQELLQRATVGKTESVFIPHGDRIDAVDNIVLPHMIRIGKGTSLEGPVLISSNCEIGKDCGVGPNVTLSSNTMVSHNSEVKDSVVFGGSKISPGTRIQRRVVYSSIEYNVEV